MTILVILGVVVAIGPPAIAASCVSAGMQGASATCTWTYVEFGQVSGGGNGHTWVVELQPNNGGILKDVLGCTEGGEAGFWHDVFMDGVDVGDVCVPDKVAPETTVAQLVVEAFRSYSWPKSNVTVQPPGGKTLVNLETIFYTSNDAPETHVLTLAGKTVTVEATPVSYVWHHGDGSTQNTSSPGHAYPDFDVSHVYGTAESFNVSVDTVYGNGRYRVGQGEWKSIPGAATVTIVGPSVELAVLEAKPQLVTR